MKVGRRQGDSDHFLYTFRSALIQYVSRLVSSLVRPCKCRAKTVNINTKALVSQQLYIPPVTWRISHILYAPSQIGLSSLNDHRFRNNSEKKNTYKCDMIHCTDQRITSLHDRYTHSSRPGARQNSQEFSKFNPNSNVAINQKESVSSANCNCDMRILPPRFARNHSCIRNFLNTQCSCTSLRSWQSACRSVQPKLPSSTSGHYPVLIQ
jgi:hypothetical protein